MRCLVVISHTHRNYVTLRVTSALCCPQQIPVICELSECEDKIAE